MSIRIYSLEPEEGFKPITLTGHRDTVVAAWFDGQDSGTIYSVGKDGIMYCWKKGRLDQDGENFKSWQQC